MCQILSTNNTENVWKPVVRICMLILGLPGLTFPFSFVEACSFTFVPSRRFPLQSYLKDNEVKTRMSLLKKAISTSEKAILADAKQLLQVLSSYERILPVYNHKRLHFWLE